MRRKWFAFEKKAAETPLIQESDIPFIDVELLSKGNLHRWFGNVLLDDRKVLTRRLMLRWYAFLGNLSKQYFLVVCLLVYHQ